MRTGLPLSLLVCAISSCGLLRERSADVERALGVQRTAACRSGTLRYEGRETRPAEPLVQLVVRNCPGRFADFEGCANGFFVLGGQRHVDFERYPLTLESSEMLALTDDDYFKAFRLRRSNLIAGDSGYARFSRDLVGASILLGKPTPRQRVRDDRRVTAFERQVAATYSVYSIDEAEFNGCVYEFNAIAAPGGRVRLALFAPPADTANR